MNEGLESVRARVGAENCRDSCAGHRCDVSLDGVPADRAIVDADAAFEAHGIAGRRCDFVLFLRAADGSFLVAPLEIKSGRVDASHATGQLQGGADFADRFASADSAGSRTACRPILFHGRPIHRAQLERLSRNRIAFRGNKFAIVTAPCDEPRNLATALGL